ncbi:reverse transcriptase (RNA-dependent DNA polymerase) [Hirsutella rhossiliensis]
MRVHGIVRRLTKEEKGLVRQAGAQLFAQQKRQTPNHNVPEQSCQSPDSSQLRSSESHAGGGWKLRQKRHSRASRFLTPCIVVATTPPHASDDNQFTLSNRRALRVFQANVGKIPPAHDTALALADSERYDIILLQEPWTGLKDGRCLTKTHPAYDTFSPVTDWDGRDTRPRVMTYVRRSAGLVADQKRPVATRDILWLTVNGTTVVNFYRQPDYDAALEILLGWCATDKCLVSGDFNAKHPSWQAGRQEHRGEDIAFWAMDNRLSLLNAVDVPTNARGSTIDLAFSNIPLADASSLAPLPLCKIRLNSDEELKRFVELVEAGAAFIPTTTSTPSELDNFASALVDLLGCAARAAGRPVRPCQAPPLQVDGRVPVDSVNTDKMIPFPNQVSFEEARDATLRTGNTSPGSEGSIHFGVLHPQQAGALPKRSAVDLVAALVHDIEEAFARKQVATLVTLDIQGAFDTVLCNRLVLRLREQGWPSNLARWAGSFMQDRSARIRYQDIVTDSSPLQCGLPQGSPVSPILFLLYTEPIYRLGHSQGRFGYADDTAILCVGNSLDETTAEASHHETDEHETWPLPSAMRRAVCACVIPVLLYAAEAWYPGPKSPRWTKPSKEAVGDWQPRQEDEQGTLHVSSGYSASVEDDTDERAAQEAGIPPVPLLLEGRRTAFAARLKALDEAHPLVQRTSRPKAPVVTVNKLIKLKYQKQPQPFRTRLRRADEMLSSCPRPALLQRGFAEEQTAPLQSASKHETAKKFRDWLQALSPRTLVVYSDGSRSEEGHIGYGYAVHRDGSTVLSGKGRLGTAEVFDAEAKGNEEADALAKAGASLPEPADGEPTLAHLRKIARLQRKEAVPGLVTTMRD